jgi:hypothetical protein
MVIDKLLKWTRILIGTVFLLVGVIGLYLSINLFIQEGRFDSLAFAISGTSAFMARIFFRRAE